MNTELKTTEGNWYVERTDDNGDFQARVLSNQGKVWHAGEEKDQIMIIVGEPSKRNGQSNIHWQPDAELIADAGNTIQSCGLLPSELLKQRDEMREMIKEAIHYLPYDKMRDEFNKYLESTEVNP